MAFNKSRLNAFVLFLLTVISLTGCRHTDPTEIRAAAHPATFTVAMDMDMPGYFTIEDEPFGYQYDLFKAFADEKGLELKILPGLTLTEISELLASGQADMAATLAGTTDGLGFCEPIYSTTFSVITRSGEASEARREGRIAPADFLENKRVMIASAFKQTPSWDLLLDSVATAATYVSSRNAIDLVDGLRSGEFDYLICEKSEAQLATALTRGITRIADFGDRVEIAAAAPERGSAAADMFAVWLDGFRTSDEYAEMDYMYLDKGSSTLLAAKAPRGKTYRGISQYDLIMREVCEREGYDWRLLSAIAYNESRFNADIVSHRGAQGLMQIMPQTARQFNVLPEEVMEPEVNIMLAAKLLGKIESMLRFGKGITYRDKLSIILACYNCGVGHVFDARRLAVKYGGNPDSWDDVAWYLQRKSEPEYLADEAVKCGRFTGSGQTLAFVSNVITRYDTYCATVTR
ncbi:MAG: transglycosylase SLT domain-containing protein [Alistipes sp.]|nr:transglycosylase SLT domain-containing protein [Alistipes sp.]